MSSDKTIRLQNLSPTNNVSVMLHQLVPSARGSMKKGPMLTPILIKAGLYYDVCAELGVTYERAQQICTMSPEVQHFSNTNRIKVMTFPPEPVAEPAVVAPVLEAALPEKVEVRPALPELWSVVLIGFDKEREIEVARELRNETGLSLTEVKALMDKTGVARSDLARDDAEQLKFILEQAGARIELVPMGPPKEEVPPPPPADEPPPEPTAPKFPGGEPSMDWSEEELRAFAAAHEVDLGKAKSKTNILRTIRAAKK